MSSEWEHCFFSPLVPASHPSEHLPPSHQNHQPSEQQSSAQTHTEKHTYSNPERGRHKFSKQMKEKERATYSSKSIRSWWPRGSRGSWVSRCTRLAISPSWAEISLRGGGETGHMIGKEKRVNRLTKAFSHDSFLQSVSTAPLNVPG